MIRTALLVVCLLFPGLALLAQQNVLSAGGNAVSAEGSVSFSVGEIRRWSYENASVKISEGIHQPYEILFMTGTNENPAARAGRVFPNPTGGDLVLQIDLPLTGTFSCRVTDALGTLLAETPVKEAKTEIDLGNRPAGTYIVELYRDRERISSWKVIKK